MLGQRIAGLVVAAALTMAPSLAVAESLEGTLSGLFGGQFKAGTGLGVQVVGTGFTPNTDFSDAISGSLNSSRALVPVPSGSFGYTYEFDESLDIFVRTSDSLGPLFTERALTLGRGKFAFSFSYTFVDYDDFDGQSLGDIRIVTPIGRTLQACRKPPCVTPLPGTVDDVIQTNLDMDLTFNSFFFFFGYGITDQWDVSLAMPLIYNSLSGSAVARIVDVKGDSGSFGSLNRVLFAPDQQGLTDPFNRDAARESFDEDSFGPGDIYLRTKYWFLKAPAESYYPDLAGVVTLTLPTGGADDFRGFEYPTGTPLLVLSRSYAFVSPHLNLGYAFRSDTDGSQFLWGAGADIAVAPWLTVVPDFLGFMGTAGAGDGVDIYQYSLGLKFNPWRQLVLGANFQFPLNDEGLRADIIYTGQVEYTF